MQNTTWTISTFPLKCLSVPIPFHRSKASYASHTHESSDLTLVPIPFQILFLRLSPTPDAAPNESGVTVNETGVAETAVNGQVSSEASATVQPLQEQEQQSQQQAVLLEQSKLFDMDLEKMHDELYRGQYLTPQDFLDDVAKDIAKCASPCARGS